LAIPQWVHRLWGIDQERQTRAQARLAMWRIDHLSAELAPTAADGAVAAVLLVEAFDNLVGRGVPESKLLSKLKGDRDVWPTWAELQAAGLIARHFPTDMQIIAEPDRSHGARHADFALEYASGERHAIEFKAIGLSDAEVAFSNAMAPLLPGLLPRFGVLTMHLEDTATTVRLNREQRRYHRLRAERLAKNLHPVARSIAAAAIVGHGTEANYARRLSRRFDEALRQLPAGTASWVAFHWSNGAPFAMVRRALAATAVPEHLAGIMLTGSVAIAGRLDSYVLILPAPFGKAEGQEIWHSEQKVEEAKAILGRVDASSGVRPTYIRVPVGGRMIDFIHRTGSRRIFPFNIVLVPDPPDLVPPRE
jgi:hypothetical protein